MMSSDTSTPYRVVDGPTRVRGERSHPSQGWFVVEFTTPEGTSVRRLCSGEGRARLVRRTDAGQRAFSAREVSEMTVSDDPSALVQRTIDEPGKRP
jgi:hypothetical protein